MTVKGWMERLSRKHLIGLAVAVGILLIAAIIIMSPGNPAPPVQEKKSVKVNLLGNADLEKEQWRATAEKEIEGIKTQQKEIADQLKTLAEATKQKSSMAQDKDRTKSTQGSMEFPPMPPFPPLPNAGHPPAQAKVPSPNISFPPASEPIRSFGPEPGGLGSAGLTASQVSAGGKGKNGGEKHREEQPYLPSGSFVPGILLSGLDAPAGVNSSKEPHPVLIKLSDLAVLPNRFRFDIKDCFIVGEGYGDLSSERAFIRTTTLSCVHNDGRSVDVPLKGFAAGEDGKVGLRGRVVSKEGLFLARAMAAGFAKGLSDVFSASATTLSVSPLGATQSVEPDKVLKVGALSGAGAAMDRLAQHYIEMAQRVFPVIEIDAGRKVDVVVLQGKPLEPVQETEVKTP